MRVVLFFKFDLSILPFGQGIALQISGSKNVKGFPKYFEKSNAEQPEKMIIYIILICDSSYNNCVFKPVIL